MLCSVMLSKTLFLDCGDLTTWGLCNGGGGGNAGMPTNLITQAALGLLSYNLCLSVKKTSRRLQRLCEAGWGLSAAWWVLEVGSQAEHPQGLRKALAFCMVFCNW